MSAPISPPPWQVRGTSVVDRNGQVVAHAYEFANAELMSAAPHARRGSRALLPRAAKRLCADEVLPIEELCAYADLAASVVKSLGRQTAETREWEERGLYNEANRDRATRAILRADLVLREQELTPAKVEVIEAHQEAP